MNRRTKVAVITGAARGFGRAVTEAFVRDCVVEQTCDVDGGEWMS